MARPQAVLRRKVGYRRIASCNPAIVVQRLFAAAQHLKDESHAPVEFNAQGRPQRTS